MRNLGFASAAERSVYGISISRASDSGNNRCQADNTAYDEWRPFRTYRRCNEPGPEKLVDF